MKYVTWMKNNGGISRWAKKVGVSINTVYAWDQKRSSPLARVMAKLVKASNYQISPYDILGIKSPESRNRKN